MVAVHDMDVQVDVYEAEPLVQLSELESRLARGYEMIDDHIAAGLPATRLEEHWLSLLADYEALCDGQSMARH